MEPLSQVVDAPVPVNDELIDELNRFRLAPKFELLPGVDTQREKARLALPMDSLIVALIDGIRENPSKLWVMGHFERALLKVQHEDTEVREHFGLEMERLMDILGIDSSDGMLSFYLGGI
jgi:Domain of unknown function (DUF4844)